MTEFAGLAGVLDGSVAPTAIADGEVLELRAVQLRAAAVRSATPEASR